MQTPVGLGRVRLVGSLISVVCTRLPHARVADRRPRTDDDGDGDDITEYR